MKYRVFVVEVRTERETWQWEQKPSSPFWIPRRRAKVQRFWVLVIVCDCTCCCESEGVACRRILLVPLARTDRDAESSPRRNKA